MNLYDLLQSKRLACRVDGQLDRRLASDDETISVSTIEAANPSEALQMVLDLVETPLALLTSSGRFYVLRPGLRGEIAMQGPEVSDAQHNAMTKFALALFDETGFALPEWYVAPKGKGKAKGDAPTRASKTTEVIADPELEVAPPTEESPSE